MKLNPLASRQYDTEFSARQALINCALEMNALGINHGKAGNVSLRWERSAQAGLLITPAAVPFGCLEPEDIVWLPMPVLPEQAAALNASSEWRFHRDLYVARPDIHALVHTHSAHATALACLPRIQMQGLPAFHYMVAAAGGEDLRCAAYETFGSQGLSDAVLLAMQARWACLMANHGQLAAGATLAKALALALEIEKLCQMYAIACTQGEPRLLSSEQMQAVVAKLSTR